MAVEPTSCLARVVRIEGVREIKGASQVCVYLVPGWQLVDQIGSYQIGDLVIYCQINTIFPDDLEITSFLKGKRLGTKNIRGELSQGLLLPLRILSEPVVEGQDLTSLLRLKKWVPDSERDLYQAVPGLIKFPDWIPRTDEERVQNCTEILPKINKITITEKRDGTSATFIHNNGKFMIASRNYIIAKPNSNSQQHFEIAKKHQLEEKMVGLNQNLAIQGEITGPKINGNRHGLKETLFHVFNIYSIDQSKYLPWDQVEKIAQELNLSTVRVVFRGLAEEKTVDYFLTLAEKQLYENGGLAEGIVVKTDDEPRISFKAISNKYLLKHDI